MRRLTVLTSCAILAMALLPAPAASARELERLPARGSLDGVRWQLSQVGGPDRDCVRARARWPSGSGFRGAQCDSPLTRGLGVRGEYVLHCPSRRFVFFGTLRDRRVRAIEARQGDRRRRAVLLRYTRPGGAEGRAWLVAIEARGPVVLTAFDREGRRLPDGRVRARSPRRQCSEMRYMQFGTGYVGFA